MATVNSALALGQGDALGRIKVGWLADLIAIPFSGRIEDIMEEIVSFDGQVPWLMVNGAVLRS